MAAATNGPQGHFTWASIISIISLIVTLAAVVVTGGWTLLQAQLVAITTRYESLVAAVKEKEEARHAAEGKRFDELVARLDSLSKTVEARRSEFVNNDEFKQFSLRFDAIKEQLRVLEATRPTTGELQAANESAKARMNELAADIRNRMTSDSFHIWRTERDKRLDALEGRVPPLTKTQP